MPQPDFEYVIFIATTPEALWGALTSPATTQQYWFGRWVESDWRAGSVVTLWESAARKTLDVTGELLRVEPPHLLSYTFQAYPGGEVLRERPSRVTFEITPWDGGMVQLRLLHDSFAPDSRVLPGIRRGWPAILSSLKSLLEGGAPLAFATDADSQPVAAWPAL
jgi:uncharacterized protein YndB with AHSA1/START domain